MKRLLVLLTIAWPLVYGVAHAQTVTLTANPTSAIGSTPVTLTWSTTPTATSCAASGDWTGTKTASGTTTLPAITANKSYVLTCSFPNVVTVPLTWVPPVTNTDNSPLTNLASYKVYFGTSATTLNQSMTVPAPASGAPVLNVANGTWFFGVTAISSTGKESSKSNTATKAVPVLFSADTENVTVTPDTTPNPPANLQVVEPTAFNVVPNFQQFTFQRGSYAGKVRIGSSCDESRTTKDGYTVISRPRTVVTPRPQAGTVLVARCA
jgi:hypothetical protein